ncbi:MAG TPA: hypothetical protein PLJ27_23665, partial [Polyangiaceae bacterium]|nr:hypothetical protein [Polyangiaceae bacterium]
RLEDMLVFCTSGTTEAPMDVLADPVSQACWLPQLESILERDRIRFDREGQKVAICLVCDQKDTLTYASLSTWLGGAGVLKINLNPEEWSKPEDRCVYLERYNPEIITGDPFSLWSMARVAPRIRPKAMVSSAMTLHQGARQLLQQQFGCPVYDIYSLTECRMIAVSTEPARYRLIRPELYVEILSPDSDIAVPEGAVGEITVTGGNNPFLPLVRYRTGDFASLKYVDGHPCLCDLEGRSPVIFLRQNREFLNPIDISRALSKVALAGFTLHQREDLSLEFSAWGAELEARSLETTLKQLFGDAIPLQMTLSVESPPSPQKVKYTSEINEIEI